MQKYFDELQANTKAIVKDVSHLSSVTYHYKPGQGRWSISQILTHILTSERLSLEYMKKKSLGIERLSETGIVEQIKFFILTISQRIALKYKAPRQVLQHTPPPLSFGDLVRQWESVRSELKAFLEGIKDENVRKMIYKHPHMGRLDVIHALKFLNEHMKHHRPQIQAIIDTQKRQMLEKH